MWNKLYQRTNTHSSLQNNLCYQFNRWHWRTRCVTSCSSFNYWCLSHRPLEQDSMVTWYKEGTCVVEIFGGTRWGWHRCQHVHTSSWNGITVFVLARVPAGLFVKRSCQSVRCCRYRHGTFQENCLELGFDESNLLTRIRAVLACCRYINTTGLDFLCLLSQ